MAVDKTFFERVQKLALSLMAEHGLEGWEFGWDRARSRYGRCNFATRKITLSAYLTPHCQPSEIRNTILHEIAHALVGRSHGHDEVWRKKALSIGCDAKRCGPPSPISYAFVGTCPCCGQKFYRHRRSRASCLKCDPKGFNPRFLIRWAVNKKISL